jgi:hypothetical protein
MLLTDAVSAVVQMTDLEFGKSICILESLGLLHPQTGKGLRLLWKLRCRFAHDPSDCSLSNPSCQKILQELRSVLAPELDQAREQLDSKIKTDVSGQRTRGLDITFPGSEDMTYLALAMMFFGIHLLVAKAKFPPGQTASEFWSVKFEWKR